MTRARCGRPPSPPSTGPWAAGRFTLEAEVFYETPGTYPDWEDFEGRFLKVTHTELDIDPARYEQIRAAFLAHLTPTGAHFRKPHRVDLLRRV